jgi:hypothetical protein
MKIFFLALTVLISLNSVAADLGQIVDFYSDKGTPKFGVQTASGIVSIMFSISGNQMAQHQLVDLVLVKFVDKNTGNDLSKVLQVDKSLGGMDISGIQAYGASLQGNEANEVSKNLKNTAIQILISNKGTSLFKGYIDLGAYCATNADHFLNLDTGKAGCNNSAGARAK